MPAAITLRDCAATAAIVSDAKATTDVVALLFSGFKSTSLLHDELINWMRRRHQDAFPHRDPQISEILENAVRSADSALTALVEMGYRDIDGRSENIVATTWQARIPASDVTERLHFFKSDYSKDQLLTLLSESPTEVDNTRPGPDDYLGYIVLRRNPQKITCGRAVLSPPIYSDDTIKPGQLADRVRTRASERISLLGIEVEVSGVPFIEQDGVVTVCAHAAAWMVHYTAVLRALVPRVPIAMMYDPLADRTHLRHRPYPSLGLVDQQIFNSLADNHLTPHAIYQDAFQTGREPHPFDRNTVADGNFTEWERENATSWIARYLNSGLPVIVGTHEGERSHVEVIIGYIRNKALTFPDTIDDDKTDDVGAFIMHDDQRGPYIIEQTGKFLATARKDDLVMAATPSGLALFGSDAEFLAVKAFDFLIREIQAEGGWTTSFDIESAYRNRDLALRTYARDGAEFRRSMLERHTCPNLRRAISLVRLPRYVWVVELISRGRRKDPDQKTRPVIGELVIDAGTGRADESAVVFAHLLDYALVHDLDTGENIQFLVSEQFYESGRWKGHRSWDALDLARRVKYVGAR